MLNTKHYVAEVHDLI